MYALMMYTQMNDEIIIVSVGTNSNQTKAQEYKVLSHHFRDDRIYSGPYRIDELLKIVGDLKPEIITIFTADMHGRIIVSFLEYFLSKKFKSVIYELSSSHRGKVLSRIIIIKMQKYV
jgi:hypothetical protein